MVFISVIIDCGNAEESGKKKVEDDAELTPSYDWHTFYGGDPESGNPLPLSSTIDSSGNVIITGIAFAAWSGDNGSAPMDAYSQFQSIFVFSNQGSDQWHTYIGSPAMDYLADITVDSNDRIILAGTADATWAGPGGREPEAPFNDNRLTNGSVAALNGNGDYAWHTFLSATNSSISSIGSSLYVVGVNATHYSLESQNCILRPNTPDPLRGIDGLLSSKSNSCLCKTT